LTGSLLAAYFKARKTAACLDDRRWTKFSGR
jgi:hypothetical protein